jgi:hypothetical protein
MEYTLNNCPIFWDHLKITHQEVRFRQDIPFLTRFLLLGSFGFRQKVPNLPTCTGVEGRLLIPYIHTDLMIADPTEIEV